MDDIKLIAYMLYSTATAALVVSGARNCSGFYNGAGDVTIRIGTPGPLTAINTPASTSTEWSRAPQNVLPVTSVRSAAFLNVTVTWVDDTTYRITTFDDLAQAAEGALWFGLYTLIV